MEWVILPWVILPQILGIIPSVLASKRGRDPVGWYLFGALLFILALPLILILPPANAKKCPKCAEFVKYEARKCRYCGTAL